MTELRAITSLRLHRDAERVPLAGDADLATLRASLGEHGQQDPIDITEDGQILDGRTRWTLLQELGATTVQARVVALPADQETNYIIDRALARRHLTVEQKRVLNALLREVVVEVVPHPDTGYQVKVGRGQTDRARTLGVDRDTVKRWDRAEQPGVTTPGSPTHIRRSNGRIQSIHPVKDAARVIAGRGNRGQAPVTKRRPAPSWVRHFTIWCHGTRPDDKELLLRLDAQIHAALDQNEIKCSHS